MVIFIVGADAKMILIALTLRVEQAGYAVLALHHMEGLVQPLANATVADVPPVDQVRTVANTDKVIKDYLRHPCLLNS